MNALNATVSKLFDLLLAPFGWAGPTAILIIGSGVFGILALIIFKQISSQKGIKAAKDRIKGHLIEIRIYQDDLIVVAKSIGKILLRNCQYVTLNFGPFIPLAVPFVLVVAQFVVRFGFAPIPVEEPNAAVLAGEGTLIQVQLDAEHAQQVAGLQIELPDGLRAVSPLVRVPSEGRAFMEVVGTKPGDWSIEMRLADGTTETKAVVTGDDPTKTMQPQRVGDFWSAWLYPAEDAFSSDSPFQSVAFVYPDRDLGWLPGGEFGILVTFVLASMAFGFAALKPLGVQI